MARIAAIVSGGIAIAAGAFVLVLFLVKIVWAWTIPDLFPGAVEEGLIAGQISWYTAFKVAIFAGVLFGMGRASTNGGS